MIQKPRNLEDDLNTLARQLAPQRPLAADIMQCLRNQPALNFPSTTHPTRKWIVRTSFALAATVALAAGLLLFLSQQPSAFAQILRKIENAQTMTCDIQDPGGATMHIAVRGQMMRAELPDGSISIGNRATGQWISLNPKDHTAMKISQTRQPFDLYAWIHDFKDGKEQRLGDKQLNGKQVAGFQVARPPLAPAAKDRLPLTLWVDPATNLPVEAEVTDSRQTFHFSHFTWDLPLDEKLFSMDIPDGYKIQDIGGISATQLQPPPSTQEAAKLILHPGIGIANLKFGDDPDRITEILGKPEKISNDASWEYPSKGLYLTVIPKMGLITIMVTAKQAVPVFNVNDFPGKLDNGLALGASRDDVEKAFGKPDRSDDPGANHLVLYYDQQSIWFMLQDNKVTQIYLNLSPAARDAIRAKLATQPNRVPNTLP